MVITEPRSCSFKTWRERLTKWQRHKHHSNDAQTQNSQSKRSRSEASLFQKRQRSRLRSHLSHPSGSVCSNTQSWPSYVQGLMIELQRYWRLQSAAVSSSSSSECSSRGQHYTRTVQLVWKHGPSESMRRFMGGEKLSDLNTLDMHMRDMGGVVVM